MVKDKRVTLVPRDLVLPTARFLSQDEQAEYEEIVKTKYNSEKARRTLHVHQGTSNLFKVIELQNQGVNVASLSDLGLIAGQHKDWIFRFYIDAPTVVLRSRYDSYKSNDFLAKDLEKQLNLTILRNPVVITGLGLEESSDSVYGLKFKITDRTKFYEAPELDYKNDKKKFLKTDERGIPIFNKGGYRNVNTIGGRLSRLVVDWNCILDSTWCSLFSTYSNGRVIVVDSAHKNL